MICACDGFLPLPQGQRLLFLPPNHSVSPCVPKYHQGFLPCPQNLKTLVFGVGEFRQDCMLPPTCSVHWTSADHNTGRVSLQPLSLSLFSYVPGEGDGKECASRYPLLVSTVHRGSVFSDYSTLVFYSQTILQVFSISLNIFHSVLLACFCGSPSHPHGLPW